ncbi:MAG TPA: isocitrate lyase/phosphoenolpyruvate mutase family protein [Rhizomicrobium sp.]|jgi:2-methylisocitrate lyase-like PEP mutase family enzyme
MMVTVAEKRTNFRRLHDSGFFVMPNAWDAGSAVRLAKLGFPAIASTSAGAAWARGKKDGELTLGEVLDHLEQLVEAVDVPINADFENGFADDPEAVGANVAKAVATGVAGISIEDWSGEKLYDLDLAVDRIAAARRAIDAAGGDAMLIGRSEHFRVPGLSVAESIRRAAAYAEAGADCLFVPMIVDPAAVRELVAAVAPKPVSVLLPNLDADPHHFASLGVRRCSTGTLLPSVAWRAFDAAAQTLSDKVRSACRELTI